MPDMVVITYVTALFLHSAKGKFSYCTTPSLARVVITTVVPVLLRVLLPVAAVLLITTIVAPTISVAVVTAAAVLLSTEVVAPLLTTAVVLLTISVALAAVASTAVVISIALPV
jgi:hypothetical protein